MTCLRGSGFTARHMSAAKSQNSKIVKLQAENVKRLQAVEISPEGNVVVIAGANGQGKSSLIDSIEYALGGQGSFAKQPVRKGADKARIVVELDTLVITRTISANGNSQLVVTGKDGARLTSPQSILDSLVGRLTFDPLAFSRQKPEEQSRTLRQIAGLDFSKAMARRQVAFDKRTLVNRDHKSMEAQLNAIPPTRSGLPEAEVSTSEILAKQQQAMERNSQKQRQRDALTLRKGKLAESQSMLNNSRQHEKELEEQIKTLTDRLTQMRANNAGVEKANKLEEEAIQNEQATVDALQNEDTAKFSKEAQDVEELNRQVRNAAKRKQLSADVHAKKQEADALTAEIEEIDRAMEKEVREAKYPIAGLTVDTAGNVLFNDLPLEQASSAEQLRVSVAIGLALNPKLRVLLVRDGSLLDDKSRALLLQLAQEHDAQVWLEQVGTQGDVSVIIEDGMVKGDT